MVVDSYKVFSSAGLVTGAAVRAFSTAVAFGDRLIMANMQGAGNSTSSISAAADAAYDGLAAVVAAAGDLGPNPGSVAVPGNARKVIAIGAVDVGDQTLERPSGRGPADSRVKPDLLGPDNVFAASNLSDTSLQLFTLTSAAAPNAAGAFALMRSFLKDPMSFDFYPGYLYANMIAFGQNFNLPETDNNNGAGLIRCPPSGWINYGYVTVNPSQSVFQSVTVSGSVSALDVAIWWPENENQAHNDVDLFLYDPNGHGSAQGVSDSSGSIWEKVHWTSGLMDGSWTFEARAYHVTTPQTVFWAFFKKS
jgi:hypothetical protein